MNKDTFIAVLSVIAIFAFGWALSENKDKKRIQGILKKKNDNYLKLLSQYIEDTKGQDGTGEKIKEQLKSLHDEYEGVDKAISKKLQTVIELISENKQEIAIEKLTLIIENILKDKYIAEGQAKDKKSCPSLFKLLEKARDLKWITNHHFNFSLFLKEKRNQEAHELTCVINENEKIIAFFSGIEIIYQLKGIKRAA
ncbi:hypothetical protein [Carboxylicivirga caseinilyticus]|uniref:hypothetical protein n=1 Tax=Carboxylicivirga caseinilyticus TaxID=3417572 RepID=UPI003D359916|nr:hypothetical protein [Marinilabiliaceae bacterium A049]